MHVELELLSDRFDVFKTFLVVGARTADPNLDFMFDQCRCELPESSDNTLEG